MKKFGVKEDWPGVEKGAKDIILGIVAEVEKKGRLELTAKKKENLLLKKRKESISITNKVLL